MSEIHCCGPITKRAKTSCNDAPLFDWDRSEMFEATGSELAALLDWDEVSRTATIAVSNGEPEKSITYRLAEGSRLRVNGYDAIAIPAGKALEMAKAVRMPDQGRCAFLPDGEPKQYENYVKADLSFEAALPWHKHPKPNEWIKLQEQADRIAADNKRKRRASAKRARKARKR